MNSLFTQTPLRYFMPVVTPLPVFQFVLAVCDALTVSVVSAIERSRRLYTRNYITIDKLLLLQNT